MSWLDRLKEGLGKTRKNVESSLMRLVGKGLDPLLLDEVEGALLSADLGVRAVDRLMARLRASIHIGDPPAAIQELRDEIYAILAPAESEPLETIIQNGPKPFVILSVGVNGVGKTTSLAKLGSHLRQCGLLPLLVAADTFRAAATEQLDFSGNKNVWRSCPFHSR